MNPSRKNTGSILSSNSKCATLSESATHMMKYIGDPSNTSQGFAKDCIDDGIVQCSKKSGGVYCNFCKNMCVCRKEITTQYEEKG